MRVRALTLPLLGLCASATSVFATSPGYFALDQSVTLESGESWSKHGTHYRLYGVQSCLRGTTFTNNVGQKLDCGDASLAIFAAFIKDTHPQCAPVVKVGAIIYAVCFATIGQTQLDLATVMIGKGFAFAALGSTGLPVNPAYAVAEEEAKQRKAGLWQFPDVQHPAVLLSHAANNREVTHP